MEILYFKKERKLLLVNNLYNGEIIFINPYALIILTANLHFPGDIKNQKYEILPNVPPFRGQGGKKTEDESSAGGQKK
jgi:hypothetical protein